MHNDVKVLQRENRAHPTPHKNIPTLHNHKASMLLRLAKHPAERRPNMFTAPEEMFEANTCT